MERTYISWTFQNWITVLLMVAIGWAIIGAVKSAIGGAA